MSSHREAPEKNLNPFFPLTGPEDSSRPPPTGEKRRQEDEHTEEEQGEAVVTRSESWWSCDIPNAVPPKRPRPEV